MLYWVSPDSLIRAQGYRSYQMMDSLSNQLHSNRGLFNKIVEVSTSETYPQLQSFEQRLVDELIIKFERSGVNLPKDQLEKFIELNDLVTDLSARYSNNMNSDSKTIILNENQIEGLSDNFIMQYKQDQQYVIPVNNPTKNTILGNAVKEAVRKEYYFKFYNRGIPNNLDLLDSLASVRYELGQIMGFDSYAAFLLQPKMSGDSETVWKFLNDLFEAALPKARKDITRLQAFRNELNSDNNQQKIAPWNLTYYSNLQRKKKYDLDYEIIREYFPLEPCLKGMMEIYQQVLGLEFKKVDNPSVWHPEIELYEVYESGKLKGRFYLDLFPRPNKESWFYGVPLITGRDTPEGYEIPSAMLLGNFTRATQDLPSLLSLRELNTLFHEFGHIMNFMSYTGPYHLQSGSKSDFVEAMSQIFENWLWNYDVLSSFAMHYETGEMLPQSTFNKMVESKNLTSGYFAISSLQSAIYDMTLYDQYDPKNPFNTDSLWIELDKKLEVYAKYAPGTHPQANWIHINGYPAYYYGYIWSDVYAQDMFTEFEKNGLLDPKTGLRYRKLILANGKRRDILEAIEEFLGRPSNNKAFIKSLGLE